VPSLIVLMIAIKRHYSSVAAEIAVDRPLDITNLAHPLVVLPLDGWTRITEKGLRFALKLSDHVEAVHVDAEDSREQIAELWQRDVVAPLTSAGLPVPNLQFLESPYRFVLAPLVAHIFELDRTHPERQIAVLVPELVVKNWFQAPLHNQRAQLLKLILLLRGNPRIMVINIPWYL